MDTEALIQEINRKIKARFDDFEGTWFIGSRMRGDHDSDSDYDLVFVFGHQPDWKEKERIRELVYESSVEKEVVIDGKYFSRAKIEAEATPFRETIRREGQFYAA